MVNVSQSKMVAPPPAFKAAGFLVVDVQERLAAAIPAVPAAVARIIALIEKARAADLPILATEQYSRGLGATIAPVRGLLAADEILEKIHFAAPREAALPAALEARRIRHCIVAGMEAHVCVLQSCLTLLARGIAVTVAGDAVAARDDLNRRLALARLARAGAQVVESVALLAAWAQPAALSS